MPDFDRDELAKLHTMLVRLNDLLIDEPSKTHLTPAEVLALHREIAVVALMVNKIENLCYPPG